MNKRGNHSFIMFGSRQFDYEGINDFFYSFTDDIKNIERQISQQGHIKTFGLEYINPRDEA